MRFFPTPVLLRTVLLMLAATVSATGYAQDSELEAAYQKEFTFLVAQKRTLLQRLEEIGEESSQAIAAVERELEQLQSKVLSLESEGDTLEELVLESERTVQEAKDNREVLQATFMQADTTFQEHGKLLLDKNGFEQLGQEEKIVTLFSAGGLLVDELSSIRKEPGEFFLRDGTKTKGTVVQVGDIASYGISDKGSGALAPAGAGNLKLWGRPDGNVAEALARGERPEPLKMFLYESLEREVSGDDGKSALDVVRSGGTIAWIIVALGALAFALVVLRVVFLKSASSRPGRLISEVSHHLRKGQTEAALEACKQTRGATARVLGATIRNLDREREHLEDVVSESILHESAHLNRFGPFILVLAAVSPLLGLLGTVTGMISTFDVITEFGTGDPKLLSGGIAVALVTTELGLIVAIPTLLVGNLLSSWAERIKDDMEKTALRITNLYLDTRAAGRAAVESAAA